MFDGRNDRTEVQTMDSVRKVDENSMYEPPLLVEIGKFTELTRGSSYVIIEGYPSAWGSNY